MSLDPTTLAALALRGAHLRRAELREELAALDRHIARLEGRSSSNGGPRPGGEGRHWTPEQRARLSRAMRRNWRSGKRKPRTAPSAGD
jgi:type II secretory pathway component PulJ